MIRIQEEDFDLAAELERLRDETPGLGAIVTFLGLVRDLDEGNEIASLFLEHYPGMTERSIERIVEEASRRWDLLGSTVIHRVGELGPRDQIVLVAVSSTHRRDAFEACQFVIDYLKTKAPIWKKELTEEGSRWVASRESDYEAVAGWNSTPQTGKS